MADAAAGIIIGNEVLTAKVQDLNGGLLAKKLRERGVPLVSLHTVADDVDAIVEALSLARRSARWVFTSGGIGPTHDDVTVRAVALALGRRIVRTPAMVELVNSWWKGATPPAEAMRFAEAPEGSELVPCEEARFPVLVCDGVHMLPGIPRLFERQLATVLERLPKRPVELKVLFLSATEAEIARVLDDVSRALPQVALGSYPAVDRECDWKVKLTVEHALAAPVAEAIARLKAALPQGSVLREE